MTTPSQPTHVIGICGGAVAGSEAAKLFAERGALAIVFEQNARPYGKIEDGLPRWHVALREKEYETIGARLSLPSVHFVPLTEIGRDVGFRELVDEWGFTGVVLTFERDDQAIGTLTTIVQTSSDLATWPPGDEITIGCGTNTLIDIRSSHKVDCVQVREAVVVQISDETTSAMYDFGNI